MTVNVFLCDQCHERPSACICADGFHCLGTIRPHAPVCHCCLCEAVTHEFVCWPVGDSYSFGPLCMECRNAKHGWVCVGLSNESVSRLVLGDRSCPG